MKYYNTYNRFGVKLPAPDYGDSPEWFKDDMFSTTSVFINEEYQGFLDMNIMEKNFKKGFSNKVKNNEPYLPTEFRNYFDPPELWKRALFVVNINDAIISQLSSLTVNELLENPDLFYKKILEAENKFEIYQNFNNSDLKKFIRSTSNLLSTYKN